MTNSRDDLMALAPCPFCGGEAERIDIPTVGSDPELGGDPNAGGSCISCKRCAASTALHFDRKENLYSSWNDRAASRSAPVDREAVAWIITWSDGETSFTRSAPSASSPKNCKYQPLYTHPQKSPDTSAAVLQEALLDATASLVAAASAYRKYASRHRRVGRAAADPFFCTRVHDFEKAAESAQAAIRQLPTTERGDK